MRHKLNTYQLTAADQLKTEIENRSTFTLNRCELSIFETHKKAENITLNFGGFTITSMLRGKKVLKVDEQQKLDYVPGETFILPSHANMIIDFPEADYTNPTQCTALVIDNAYFNTQLDYINENFARFPEDRKSWQLSSTQALLQNDERLSLLGNRLIKLFTGTDPLKDILVDIRIKELVLSLLQLQNYTSLTDVNSAHHNVSERFKAVVEYVRKNITGQLSGVELSKMACMSKSVFYRTFTKEFGIPPNQLVLQERIRQAKLLMASESMSIKEVCYASGFSDPNYFSRAFKRMEGITPGEYLNKLRTVA